VHGRVGDGQLIAERAMVGQARLGGRDRLRGPAGHRQGRRARDGANDPGPPVLAGDPLEHGQRLAGVAGERQHRRLVSDQFLGQRPGGDDRTGGGVDGQRRLRVAQSPLGVLRPGDRRARRHLLTGGQPLAAGQDPLGVTELAQLIQRLPQQ
jgi:hypothetical protein